MCQTKSACDCQLQAQCTIPLVIGVIGHRQYPAGLVPVLKAALKQVFSELHEYTRHSPLLILSSLAQGADQLGVEVALEMRVTDGLQFSVVAPLPFPVEEFARSSSFDPTPEGQAAAQRMLRWLSDGTATGHFIHTPGATVPEGTPWPVQGGDAAAKGFRARCYANCGAYLVRCSQVVVALWDEEGAAPASIPPTSITAELIHYQISGTRPELVRRDLSDLSDEGIGPAFIIHTPRDNVADPEAGDVRIRVRHGDGTNFIRRWKPYTAGERVYHRIKQSLGIGSHAVDHLSADSTETINPEWSQFLATCATLDDYNRDLIRYWDTVRGGIPGALRTFLHGKDANAPTDPQPWRDPVAAAAFERLVRVRSAAGTLSRILQGYVDQGQRWLFVVIGLAALASEGYGHEFQGETGAPQHSPVLLACYLAFSIIPLLIVLGVWYARLDEKRLDYRALAEALRAHCWWALAGVEASVADSYLSQLHSDVAWARNSVLGLSPPPLIWRQHLENSLDQSERHARLALIRKQWVQAQIKYYKDKFKENHRRGTRLRIIALGCAVIAVGVPALVLLTAPLRPPEFALTVSALLLLTGGLCIAYCERQSYEELAHQYDRMCVVFTKADYELGRIAASDGDSLGQIEKILRLLGREAILEHAQWVVLRRSRAFEVPIH